MILDVRKFTAVLKVGGASLRCVAVSCGVGFLMLENQAFNLVQKNQKSVNTICNNFSFTTKQQYDI